MQASATGRERHTPALPGAQAFIELQQAHQQREDVKAEVGAWRGGCAAWPGTPCRLGVPPVASALRRAGLELEPATPLPRPATQLHEARRALGTSEELARELAAQRDDLVCQLAAQQAAGAALQEQLRQAAAQRAQAQRALAEVEERAAELGLSLAAGMGEHERLLRRFELLEAEVGAGQG